MKNLFIICEGPTEQEFCEDVLKDHLSNVELKAPLIKHSGGGVVSWSTLLNQIIHHLNESDSYVTTFIDYYGIKDDFKYPSWEEGKKIANKEDRMTFLEQAMKDQISESTRYRFIPHLQLHEFETLLFCDVDVFKNWFEPTELCNLKDLQDALVDFDNRPENINNSSKTAPSKRKLKAVPSYDKVIAGNCIAMDIGLKKMLDMCPHFRRWIEELKTIN